MKKASILVVVCFLAGMMLSSCRSSVPCAAYSSVGPTAFVDQPASDHQPG